MLVHSSHPRYCGDSTYNQTQIQSFTKQPINAPVILKADLSIHSKVKLASYIAILCIQTPPHHNPKSIHSHSLIYLAFFSHVHGDNSSPDRACSDFKSHPYFQQIPPHAPPLDSHKI